MEATLKLIEGLKFVATTGSGHSIVLEGVREGMEVKTTAPASLEVCLVSLGSCIAMDIAWILTRMRQKPDDLVVKLKAKRADETPKVFTEIDTEVLAKGRDISENSLKRAIDLSLEKYCPVGNMLQRGGVKISSSYKIEG